jgi:hypothetical protein
MRKQSFSVASWVSESEIQLHLTNSKKTRSFKRENGEKLAIKTKVLRSCMYKEDYEKLQ